MKAVCIFIFTFLQTSFLFSQTDTSKLTKKEILLGKLKSVKYADLGLSDEQIKYVISRGAKEASDFIAIHQYLSDNLKLSGVIVKPQDRDIAFLKCNSSSEVVSVSVTMKAFESDLLAIGNYPFTISFKFADQTSYTYDFPVSVSGLTISLPKAIIRNLKKNIGDDLTKVNPIEINISKGQVIADEKEINQYFESGNNKTKIEGFYTLVKGNSTFEKMAIIKKNDLLCLLNRESRYFAADWSFGELRGIIEPSLSSSYFTGKLKRLDKTDAEITLTIKEDNIIEIFRKDLNENWTFVKTK